MNPLGWPRKPWPRRMRNVWSRHWQSSASPSSRCVTRPKSRRDDSRHRQSRGDLKPVEAAFSQVESQTHRLSREVVQTVCLVPSDLGLRAVEAERSAIRPCEVGNRLPLLIQDLDSQLSVGCIEVDE